MSSSSQTLLVQLIAGLEAPTPASPEVEYLPQPTLLPQGARPISVLMEDGGVIVAYELPGSGSLPFGVDAFRFASAAESDPEIVDPRVPGSLVRDAEIGGDDASEIPDMIATAKRYLVEAGAR